MRQSERRGFFFCVLQWFPIDPISQVEMCSVRTFLRFGLPSTRKRVLKASKKSQVSKTGLQGILSIVEILENTGFSFTCGRTKNCYDNIKT